MPNTAGLAFQTPSTSESDVTVFSAGPGVCHIELTFATGFTYSTDVTFTQVSEDGCACPSLFAATSGPFTVNNPSDTCVDAGLDAQAFDPETGATKSSPPDYCERVHAILFGTAIGGDSCMVHAGVEYRTALDGLITSIKPTRSSRTTRVSARQRLMPGLRVVGYVELQR